MQSRSRFTATGRRRKTVGERAIAPLLGVLVLVVITVALATVVAAIGAGALSLGSTAPTATFDLSAEGGESTVAIEHVAGDTIDVEALSVTIAVDDTELDDQPPVPFVGADGFDGTPTGPFNAESDPEWGSGTEVAVTIADTNSHDIDQGDSVAVTLTVDGYQIATLETTAQ